jgi:uncharacterized membrane protein YphA (DoxX/SURF4 family)
MTAPTLVSLRREPGALIRSLTALLLRASLGLIFLLAGLGKLQAMKAETDPYPAQMLRDFEKTPLRPDLVRLFARVLPYAEVALGGALLGGVLTPLAATLSGVLLLNLLFGTILLGDPTKFPPMLVYILVNAGVLWLSPVPSNYLSLDGLLLGWFWRPRNEGQYRREEIAERLGR